MAIQSKNLVTPYQVLYTNYKMLLLKITYDLPIGKVKMLGMEKFPHTSVLYYSNFSIEHMIVRECKIVGIVG